MATLAQLGLRMLKCTHMVFEWSFPLPNLSDQGTLHQERKSMGVLANRSVGILNVISLLLQFLAFIHFFCHPDPSSCHQSPEEIRAHFG